jgi:hypothetical protein
MRHRAGTPASAPAEPFAFAPDDEHAWQRLARGYRLAGLLISAHRLGLLERLARGQATLDALCRDLEADPTVVEQMCRGLLTGGLLRSGDMGWRLSDAGQRLVNDPAAAAELASLALDYQRWGRLDERARELATEEHPDAPDVFGGRDDVATAHRYALRLAARHRGQAVRLLRAVRATRPLRVMDVGGADGFLAREVCARWPDAECVVLEHPSMAEVARRACADEPRISVLEGDFLGDGQQLGEDPFPNDVDVVVLSHVLQGMGQQPQRDLVCRAAAALSPGGCLLSCEAVLRSDKRGPMDTVLWAIGQASLGHRGHILTTVEHDILVRAAGLAASAAWWVSDSTRAVLGVNTAAAVTPALAVEPETVQRAAGSA